MAFKNLVVKLRQALLCCSKRDQKHSLDIGSPTNVRRVDISESLPGLTDAERKYIREKASSDAIHLLGLQSQPPTTAPSPSTSASTSRMSSREPSVALLNAASANLPSAIPTPPRHRHTEFETPTARMKSMYERRDSTDSEAVYESVEPTDKGLNESFMTLNLEFDWEDKKNSSESLRTLNLSEGFEMQDTTGGHSHAASPVAALKTPPTKRNKVIERAITSVSLAESSDSEGESVGVAERSPLVRA